MVAIRVLVAEDEDPIRELMVEMLTDAGFTVDEATNADDVVKLLDVNGYGLLVTNVHMPGNHDGIELAEHAQEHGSALPVVFVSGRPDVYSRLQATGIKGVALAKPFALEELVAAVRLLAKAKPD